MAWLTFFVIVFVHLVVIISCWYLAVKIKDYRGWAYMGLACAFTVMLAGCISIKFELTANGDSILIFGVLMALVFVSLFVVVRAGDKWFQTKGFDLKESWQKQKTEDKPCQAQPVLSVPPHLSKS